MRVFPSGKLGGILSGASVLYYYGDPDIGTFETGGASIVRKGV